MKKIFSYLKPSTQKGQSMVEMAIIAPILIFLLLGVFEVGWALRGYLILANANREVTRYAIRPGYLNYSVRNNNPPTSTTPFTPAVVAVQYDRVMSYNFSTLSGQLPMDFSTGQTATFIISHIVVDTAIPCKNMNTCDCNAFVSNPNYISSSNVLTMDDLILHPGVPGYENFYYAKFPPTSTYQTKYNFPQEAMDLARQNNKFNCELLRKSVGTLPSSNNVIITEIYYNQPQLFGFPVISNPFTDPVPMYAHTAMRMVVASRSSQNSDSVGPVCAAYPITFRQDVFANPISPTIPMNLDIYEGESPGNFGWLAWNPTHNNSAGYVEEELANPRMSLNDFSDYFDRNDHLLSLGDNVSVKTGVANTDDINDLLQGLVGQEILIPVYDTSTGTGNNKSYHITHFARVQITEACLPRNNQCDGHNTKQIKGTFLGYNDNACPPD